VGYNHVARIQSFTFNEAVMALSPGTISRLLVDWRDGDKTALDRLVPLVYRELAPASWVLHAPAARRPYFTNLRVDQ
jgi:hypothetical protein